MNYWERHIGDYARDTGHLSIMEHGVYTILLDRYYATERPIPADQAHRIARARTEEERAAVDSVLEEFFTLQDGHWINNRCEEVIEEYREGAPAREVKRQNAAERQRRARERRGALFNELAAHGIHPDWNATTAELKTLLNSVKSQPVTQPVTRDVTATRHQTPDTSNNSTLCASSSDDESGAGPTRSTPGDVAYWRPTPEQLNPRIVMAGIPVPEPPDIARMLQAFQDYHSGRHYTEGQCYQKFVNWIQRERINEKPSTGSRHHRPLGFATGDAIGDDWLAAERQREASPGIVSGLD